MTISVDDISAALSRHVVKDGDGDHAIGTAGFRFTGSDAPKPAGVLVPLIERAGGVNVILTQRSEQLRQHAGQVSFPGGRHDDTDPDMEFTALREAEEEIGLPRGDVTILGSLNYYRTGTGFQITPVVGHVPARFEAVPEPGEVADVFEVPLTFLMDEANYELRSRVWKGKERHFYAMDYDNRFIWGATAGILVGMSRVVRTYLGMGET